MGRYSEKAYKKLTDDIAGSLSYFITQHIAGADDMDALCARTRVMPIMDADRGP